MQTDNLIEIRCTGEYWDAKAKEYSQCNKLLAKLPPGTVYQIKCQRCGKVNEKEKQNG